MLEGSVLRDQGRVWINVQLIDAQSGAHIWADRFEEDVADLFKLQDEVVGRLANTLGNELVKAEARGDTNLDAFDLAMRGRAKYCDFQRRPTREINLAARALFERALAINPDVAGALWGDATKYIVEKAYGWTSPGDSSSTASCAQGGVVLRSQFMREATKVGRPHPTFR